MNIPWDAKTYAENFSFVSAYGSDLLQWLTLGAGVTVLDLGCGTGTLTRELAQTGAIAIGLDASPEQLEIAKGCDPKLRWILADATDFSLPEPVDAVLSNAMLHWIDADKQRQTLQCIGNALKSGGEFVFEMGGQGNNQWIHAALAEAFSRYGFVYQMPFYFPSIGQYAALLEQAGFQVREMRLFDRKTPLKGKNGMADWLRMFLKTPFQILPEACRPSVLQETVRLLKPKLWQNGVWYADYVRLRGKAIRGNTAQSPLALCAALPRI